MTPQSPKASQTAIFEPVAEASPEAAAEPEMVAKTIEPVAVGVLPPKPDPLARPPKPTSLARPGNVSGKGRPRLSSSAKGKASQGKGAVAVAKARRKPGNYARPGKVSGKGGPKSSGSAKRKASKGKGTGVGGMMCRVAGTYKLPPSLLDVGKYKATKVRRDAVPRVPKGASKVGSEPFSVAS